VKGPVAAAFVVGLAVALLGWILWPRGIEQRSAAQLMDVVMWGREPIGGPFRLIDHNGATRTDADFRGKLLLIYFGFTYCSDV
jgi:protein SCO1/2